MLLRATRLTTNNHEINNHKINTCKITYQITDNIKSIVFFFFLPYKDYIRLTCCGALSHHICATSCQRINYSVVDTLHHVSVLAYWLNPVGHTALAIVSQSQTLLTIISDSIQQKQDTHNVFYSIFRSFRPFTVSNAVVHFT